MSTLCAFWDTTVPHRTERVHFWGLVNSATKFLSRGALCGVPAPIRSGDMPILRTAFETSVNPETLHPKHYTLNPKEEFCFFFFFEGEGGGDS